MHGATSTARPRGASNTTGPCTGAVRGLSCTSGSVLPRSRETTAAVRALWTRRAVRNAVHSADCRAPTAAPMIAGSSLRAITSNALPCSGLIFTMSCSARCEHGGVDEAGVRTRQEEPARPVHVDAARRGCRDGPMPQPDERGASRVAARRVGEHLFGFHVEEAQAHAAVARRCPRGVPAAAAAERLLRIERDDDVPAFPDAGRVRVASEADAAAERPHAGQRVELPARRGDARRDRIRVVQHAARARRPLSASDRLRASAEPFICCRFGESSTTPSRMTPGKPDADDVERTSAARPRRSSRPMASHDLVGRQRREHRAALVRLVRVGADRADDPVAFDQPGRDVFHREHADCMPHASPPVPPASSALNACVRQSGRRLLSSPSQTRELVETVERRRLVALRQRRVVEDRVDEVVDRAAQREHRLADVNQLRGALRR